MMRPPFTTSAVIPNIDRPTDPRYRCHHCDNAGMVCLDRDDDQQPVGAPCPFCQRGKSVDAGGWDMSYGKSERVAHLTAIPTGIGAGFWTRHDLAAESWENGYTIRHTRRCQLVPDGRAYPCGQPAMGAYCDHHAANRPGVVGSVRELARGVGAGPVMSRVEAGS